MTKLTDVPELVVRAQELAVELGFPLTRQPIEPGAPIPLPSACLPGVGRFLAVLAAGCVNGVIGEYGTGTGVGTAWMASAMPGSCRLLTAEFDPERAENATRLFAADERVQVLAGDAVSALAGQGPYDLIFADCGIRQDAAFDSVVDLLKLGGRVVMDDVTPMAVLPDDSPYKGGDDIKRRLFGNPRLVSAEVVLPDLANSLLVGTRVA